MNLDPNKNYLTNSLANIQQFVNSAADELRHIVYKSKYGYGSASGPAVKNVAELRTAPEAFVASAVGDVLTDQSRKEIWKYTNIPRMAGEIGKAVSAAAGMDPVTGAVLTIGAPAVLLGLSGRTGPLSQGMRPKGYKAVAPASKEKDPTGRTPQSIPLEIALRYGLGQTSQILPYQEFKKERPDVAPSTYTQYRRYEHSKPEPGKLIGIDPEGQSFTTIGGLVRGSAKGLNDPEIRLKGMPVTLSGALGTAAGLGAASAAYAALPIKTRYARSSIDLSRSGPTTNPITGQVQTGAARTYSPSSLTTAGIAAIGLGTAVAVGAATKKVLQKAADNRIKKDNPVEYLKQRHGSLEQASIALGLPQAQSWQQLTPYVK